MISSPKISVLMPVWNGEKFLAESVDSILTQTFTDFELLVIDDGSTDRTMEILRTYSDSRLRVLRLNHGGIVVALNHGLSQARGEWIARLDSDDLCLPRRLELQWRALNRHPQAVLCHTAVTCFGETNWPVGQARLPRSRSFTALRLCYQCPIVHSSVLFKKSVALAAGGYLLEERHAEDYSLWGRMLEHGEFIGLTERLVQLRLHIQSVSRQNLETQLTLTRQIGIRHCQKFLRLNEADASRANALLMEIPRARSWRDWWWFLYYCVPRLRWKSVELYAWLGLQTLKMLR